MSRKTAGKAGGGGGGGGYEQEDSRKGWGGGGGLGMSRKIAGKAGYEAVRTLIPLCGPVIVTYFRQAPSFPSHKATVL